MPLESLAPQRIPGRLRNLAPHPPSVLKKPMSEDEIAAGQSSPLAPEAIRG